MRKVYVFGSNLQGRHGKGSALRARNYWGAEYGVGRGMTGRAYALPTKVTPYQRMDLQHVEANIKEFIKHAKENPKDTFYLARPGCNNAGFTDAQIAPLFKGSPKNIVIPFMWEPFWSGGRECFETIPLPRYALVGSQKTQELAPAAYQMGFDVARFMANQHWCLRSGGARGMDVAGEAGCDYVKGCKEIFLGNGGVRRYGPSHPGYMDWNSAYQLAEAIHPAWDKCNPGVRKLHARNCFQILGARLDRPVKFMVCWTLGGQEIGGTRTAIKIAQKFDIPYINIGGLEDVKQTVKLVKELVNKS